MTEPGDVDKLGRGPLSDKARIGLLERDIEEHSRIISEFVDRGRSFSDQQKEQLREIFRGVLADSGLRIDEAEHVDAAREDFRFVRRLRLTWETAANKVGSAVLSALIVVGLTIAGLGFWAWINSGGGK